MPSPILFAGGEDINFAVIGGSMQSTVTNNNPGIDTTAGRFRSGYARHAITFALNNGSGVWPITAQTPPSELASGGAPAETGPGARFTPLMLISPPTAIAGPPSAEFTTLEITGLASAASKSGARIVNPDTVSAKI